MGYGYEFISKGKIAAWAKEYTPNHPEMEEQVRLAQIAWYEHKMAQEKFFEFLRENKESEE